MELKKDYELRRYGSKIILRQIDPATYDFKTIMVADELIEEKQKHLFVLKNQDYCALFRERNNQLFSVRKCRDYKIEADRILVLMDIWYWWTDEFELTPLGRQLGKNDLIFVLRAEEKFVLSYFSEGEFVQIKGVNIEELAAKEIFCLEADVAKIETEQGWKFISILSRREAVYYPGMRFSEYRTVFRVIMSEDSLEKTVDYYNFVKEFLKQKNRFGVIIGYKEKFSKALWEGQRPTNGLVLLPSFGNCLDGAGVITINADTWRLFNGEKKGAYRVRSTNLYYDKAADEVEMGEFDGQACLVVKLSGHEDKILYRKKGLKTELELISNESAS